MIKENLMESLLANAQVKELCQRFMSADNNNACLLQTNQLGHGQ